MEVYIIKNSNEDYVSVRYEGNKIFCVTYDGMAVGFTYYTNKKTVQKDLNKIGENYKLSTVELLTLPKGKRTNIFLLTLGQPMVYNT